jgi:hypothetical protein
MTSLRAAQAWASTAMPDHAMKRQKKNQSGALGDTVASRNRFGEYDRKRVSPKHPRTAPQLEVWGNMGYLSWLWNRLREDQRVAWRRRALEVHSRPNMLQSGKLDGPLLFKKINRVLATCGREPLFDPPPLPQFGPNPVEAFRIHKGRWGPVFKLKVSQDIQWEARPPLEDIMVYGWTPLNAGVDKNDLYVFLGLLGPPAGGESDFTQRYMKKLKEWRKLAPKRYHVPLEGAKVFIRVWQQENGWENQLGMFRASAFVPVEGAWRAAKTRHQ